MPTVSLLLLLHLPRVLLLRSLALLIPVVAKSMNTIADFKRGIKRDETQYAELKDERFWDQWNRALLARARAHDISEVFDPSYKPTTQVERELFREKKAFAYSVLNRCVLTDVGKSLVRQHEHDFDAQAVYSKLVHHAKNSTSAKLAVEKLVDYITTARLDSTWRGTSQGFLYHWREQLRLLMEMTPSTEHYADNVKKRMLEAAVRHVSDLRHVKRIDEQRIASGEFPLPYEAYFDLLMSAAVQRDEELGVSAKSRRTVNSSTRQENFFPYSGDGYIDSDFRDLTIQAADRRPDPTRRPYIEEDLWHRLPPEAQQILRSMNPKSANATPSRGVNSHDLFYTETPAVDDAWPEEETHDLVPEDEPAEEQLVGDDLPPDPMSTPEEEDHSPNPGPCHSASSLPTW